MSYLRDVTADVTLDPDVTMDHDVTLNRDVTSRTPVYDHP